jgi:hypothetical protein
MLVACRLAGLSALEAYYAGVSVGAIGGACGCAARFFWVSADGAATASQQTPGGSQQSPGALPRG